MSLYWDLVWTILQVVALLIIAGVLIVNLLGKTNS